MYENTKANKTYKPDLLYPELSYKIIGILFDIFLNLGYGYKENQYQKAEIKQGNRFNRKDIERLYNYLKSTNLKLGILARFTKAGVKFKRIVNIK